MMAFADRAEAHTVAELETWTETWTMEADIALSPALTAALADMEARHPWYYSPEDAPGGSQTTRRSTGTTNWVVGAGVEQWRPLVYVADAAMAYAMCLDAPLEAVGGQVFNVGSNEQNFQIGQLGDLIKEVLPDIELETIPQSPALRDYHVSFDKISDTLG